MSIFRDFFDVKQKPIFTGLRFGFGSGGAAADPPPPSLEASGGNVNGQNQVMDTNIMYLMHLVL